MVSWAIMHRNARLMVREPRSTPLWVIHMIRSVVGAYIAWNALSCQVLSSAAVNCRFQQEYLAGRQCLVPTGKECLAKSTIFSRWPFSMAGSIFSQPVVFHNTHRNNLGSCAIFREAEQWKQRQLVHGRDFPSGTERALHWALFPGLVTAFVRLVNLLIN